MIFNIVSLIFALLFTPSFSSDLVRRDEIIKVDRTFERQGCSEMGVATLENARGENGKARYPNQDRACAITVQNPFNVEHGVGEIAAHQMALGELMQPYVIPGAFIVGVFDGHGNDGDKIASLTRFLVTDYLTTFFKNNVTKILYHDFLALAKSVQTTFQNNKFAQESGATACFCLLEGPIEGGLPIPVSKEQAVTAKEHRTGMRTVPITVYRAVFNNIGDSRSIVIRNNEVVFSTVDHKPTTPAEKMRIEKSGGYVLQGYAWGADGSGFALSRSWGDCLAHKNGVLLSVPEIYSFGVPLYPSNSLLRIQENSTYLHQGDILVFATDGLWDVFENQEIADYIMQQKNSGKDLQNIAQELAQNARIGHNNMGRKSRDDITLIIAQL